MPETTLSVVILNYRTSTLLLRCLQSVERHAPAAEVIVVDNASPDNSVSVMQQHYPRARLVLNTSNVGFARGMNQGLAAATGGLLLALNADTELVAATLPGLMEAVTRWPGAGIIGPAQHAPNPLNPSRPGRHLASAFADPTLLREAARLLLLADSWQARLRRGPWQLPGGPARSVDWLMGAALLFRRECLADIGGFDEGSFMYGEDWDVCYRARQAGWQVVYVPNAPVLHHENAAGAKHFGAYRLARVLQGEHYFHRKHYGRWSGQALIALYLAGTVLRLVGRLLWRPFASDTPGWAASMRSQWNTLRMTLRLLWANLTQRAG